MKSFRILLGLVACFGLCSVAHATDLSLRAPHAPTFAQAASPSWAGFYAGVNAGYAWGSKGTDITGNDPVSTAVINAGVIPSNLSANSGGALAGVQAGYNWQSGMFVYGVEADANYANMTATTTDASGVSMTSRLEFLGSVTARAGLSFGNWLAYAKAGGAYGIHRATTDGSVLGVGVAGSSTDGRFGWTAGAGVEYALAKNWSVGLEYDYYDLGKTTYTVADGTSTVSAAVSVPVTANIARARLNFRF